MSLSKPTLSDKLRYLFGGASLPTRLNTAKALWDGRRGNPRPARPWMVQVEVTNRCNLNCIFCSRHENDLLMGDMDPALYDQVVAISAKAQETALFGYGEPLMSRAFFDLLPRLKSSRIGFFTNGMLLNAALFDKVIQKAGPPLSYIVFSIDGGRTETFEKVRPKASFEKVMANLTEVAERRRALGLDFILRLEFVAMRDNVQELPALIEMADRAGVDYIKVSHLVVWNESLRDQSLVYHQELGRQAFEAAEDAAAGRRIGLDLPKTLGQAPTGMPPCRMPWNYVMISFEGDVRACCFSPEMMTMGSLKNSNFEEIWLSEKYQQLRQSLFNGSEPPCCLICEERYRLMGSANEEATYVKLQPRKK